MAIRKQVDELTTEDLDQFPIWEFALDEEGKEGQDEATVRPVNILRPTDPLEGSRLVKAQFTYADGSTAYGYLTPATDSTDLGAVQPVVITADGQVAFWCGIIEPSSKRYTALLFAFVQATLFGIPNHFRVCRPAS